MKLQPKSILTSYKDLSPTYLEVGDNFVLRVSVEHVIVYTAFKGHTVAVYHVYK